MRLKPFGPLPSGLPSQKTKEQGTRLTSSQSKANQVGSFRDLPSSNRCLPINYQLIETRFQ